MIFFFYLFKVLICMWWVKMARWLVKLLVSHQWLACVYQHHHAPSTRANTLKVFLWWPMKLDTSRLSSVINEFFLIEINLQYFFFYFLQMQFNSLGMRHDTMELSCDPTSHIMSPTLGSGKITWSQCSKTALNKFLE